MQYKKNMIFKVVTVGWEPDFINYLLNPIEKRTGIDFTHGLVGDASRINYVKKKYPRMKLVALSKTKKDPLPDPDFELLASLECVGVPTIKSMVLGDPYIRHRSERETLGYATLLARSIQKILKELQPDIVLASNDCLHSAMSLAVAKSLGIPWVAMAFPVIPDNLTGFCKALTPDRLVPITRTVDDHLRRHAENLIQNVRLRAQKVVAYRAPVSLTQWVRQYLLHSKNLLRRMHKARVLGIDRYTCPSIKERLYDISRRSFNQLCLPTAKMLDSPPDGRFVYYPFHMSPESMIDTWAPFYQNQVALVAQLSLALPADIAFVIKLHFSDPANYGRQQLQQLMKLPRMHIAHPDALGCDFIEKAALVVGITGTSCLEAALRGKSVLIFGDSPYQHFPRTERAKRPDELYEQIRKMLNHPPPTDEEIIEAFAIYMARYMPGRINDWSKPIGEEDIAKLAECFLWLRLYIERPGCCDNWYNEPPFVSV